MCLSALEDSASFICNAAFSVAFCALRFPFEAPCRLEACGFHCVGAINSSVSRELPRPVRRVQKGSLEVRGPGEKPLGTRSGTQSSPRSFKVRSPFPGTTSKHSDTFASIVPGRSRRASTTGSGRSAGHVGRLAAVILVRDACAHARARADPYSPCFCLARPLGGRRDVTNRAWAGGTPGSSRTMPRRQTATSWYAHQGVSLHTLL